MYKIGEFSKITNLSVKTLRYYDEIGLLIPEEVDIYTSYRYYGESNLQQVKIINDLKDAGFSLEEIKNNWNNFTEKIFNKKKEELYKEIDKVSDKIKKIDYLRNNINKNNIKLKKL